MATELSTRFDNALAYAASLHREQRRKASGVPYVAHLLGVAAIVLEHGGDEEEAIAALLHDAPEDQGGEAVLSDIQQRFGARVAEIVTGCSDAVGRPKPPWRPRKEAFITRLRVAGPSVHLVVMADKLHNVLSIVRDYRTCGDQVWERFRAGRDGTLWYYRAVVEALRPEGNSTLLFEELEEAVGRLEGLDREQGDAKDGLAWYLGFP